MGEIPLRTNTTLIARHLERIGDRACKMAENIHSEVTGERVYIQPDNALSIAGENRIYLPDYVKTLLSYGNDRVSL
jgi:phosphate uptake regulator